jgi:formylglycine-generating enzyme required for sulfatase activity
MLCGGRPSGSNRVIRGGSWNNNAINCRAANRNNNWPDNRNNNLGFRFVLPPAQPGRPKRE